VYIADIKINQSEISDMNQNMLFIHSLFYFSVYGRTPVTAYVDYAEGP